MTDVSTETEKPTNDCAGKTSEAGLKKKRKPQYSRRAQMTLKSISFDFF